VAEEPAPAPDSVDEDRAADEEDAGGPAFVSWRFAALDAAVDAEPDAAANYLLRGELWLRRGRPAEAIPDFDRAITLLKAQTQADDWDSVGYALLARAESGLEKAIEAVRNVAKLRDL
jgi:predicted Zn-dependent protease